MAQTPTKKPKKNTPEKSPWLLKRGETDYENIKSWQAKLSIYKKSAEKYRGMWQRFRDYYENNYYGSDLYGYTANAKTFDQISVNMLFANVQQILPSIYSRNPNIIVKPRRPEDVKLSHVVEALLNTQLDELNFKEEMELAILDGLILGVGFMKLGWVFETELKDVDETFSFNEFVKIDEPFVQRVSPFNIVIPLDCKSLQDAPWIMVKSSAYLDDVKANPLYENTKDLKPTGRYEIDDRQPEMLSSMMRNSPYMSEEIKTETERVFLYEIWDKRTEKYRVMAEGHEKWLRNVDKPYTKLDGFPIEMFRLNPVGDKFFGVSDVQQYEPQLIEKNNLRTAMLTHFKRMARKFLIPTGALSEEATDNLTSAEDSVVVELEGGKDVVGTLTENPVPADNYQLEGLIDRDTNILSGVSEFNQGQRGKGRRTAAEANIASQSASLRQSFRLQKVNDFVRNIARKLLQLDTEFLDQGKVIQLVGQNGEEWHKISSLQLAMGQFSVDVQASSSQPVDKNVRLRQLTDLLQLVGNSPLINQRRLMQMLLEEFGVDAETLMQPDQGVGPAAPGGPQMGKEAQPGGQAPAVAPVQPPAPGMMRNRQSSSDILGQAMKV